MKISPATRLYALVGDPVVYSLSPVIQNALFDYYQVSGVYLAFRVGDLRAALESLRVLSIAGLSVTMPYKQEILAYLDWVDPLAAAIGAVNTVVHENGLLKGYNTDAPGFYDAISACGYDFQGQSVLLIGTGATAKALIAGMHLYACPKKIVCVSRSPRKLETFLAAMRVQYSCDFVGVTLDAAAGRLENMLEEVSCVCNASPVGMPHLGNRKPLPVKCLPRHIVFDVVYKPYTTPFLADAQKVGARIVRGMEMFVGQALRQFELWTGMRVEKELLRGLLNAELLHFDCE